MVAPSIKVEGLKELRSGLRRIKDKELDAKLKTANKTFAEEIVSKALPNVPVKTGRLKSSVKGIGRLTGAVGKAGTPSRVNYAAAVHWGRDGKSGRPFLTDAADRFEREAADRYLDEIDQVFELVRSRL